MQIGLEGTTQRAAQKVAAKPAPPEVDLLPHRSRTPDDATCDGFEAWTKYTQQKRLTEPAPTAAVAAVTGYLYFPTADCVLHFDAQGYKLQVVKQEDNAFKEPWWPSPSEAKKRFMTV